MAISQEVTARKTALALELEAAKRRAEGNGKSAYLWSQFLFMLALACSVAAAITGLFSTVSAKIVGGIAALPPIIAFVATNLKLEARSRWHYKKSYGMDALRSRLLYQLPEEPTTDNISAIALDRDKLNALMEIEWQPLQSDFGGLLKPKSTTTPQSTESSAAPTPNQAVEHDTRAVR
jgi:hypothetical protein